MDPTPRIGGKRPLVDTLARPIDRAIACGCNAPNPHNTQAWKLRNESDLQTLLYVDEKRLLPATDPPTRQIHIGCGCFIECLAVGASALGFDTQVEEFPEGYYGLKEVGRRPVARITLTERRAAEDDLAQYLYVRQTNRQPSSDETLVSDRDLTELARSIADHRVQFIGLNDHVRMKPLLRIFDRAQTIECENRRVFEETRIWFRFSESERARKRDGLSLPQTGMTGLRVPILEWYLKHGDAERWHNPRSIHAYLKTFRRALATTQGLVLLKTATNTQTDWLRTGRAYARVSLTGAKLGWQMHPHSQVLEEFAEMEPLQREFNALIGVTEGEKVQMAVRLGTGRAPYYTYRREVESFLCR